jgi:hypothetical protein
MNIYYKILEVVPDEHSVVVRYYTDKFTEDMLDMDVEHKLPRREDGSPVRCRTDYNLNLPVPAPKGEELHQYLMRCAPVDWFDIKEQILNPNVDTSLKHIQDQIGKPKTFTIDEVKGVPVTETSLTEQEILDLINKSKT